MSNFTNSELIDLRNISPHSNNPRNQPISKLTPHHFAGNSTIEGVSNFLARPTTRASYNYGIGSDGRRVLIVEERNRCWGSSSGWNDHQAIVIGVANNTGSPTWGIADRAYESMLELMVDCIQRNSGIQRRNGQPGLWFDGTQNASLTYHRMFSPQICPGPWFLARMEEIVRLVNARLDVVIEPNWQIDPNHIRRFVELGIISSPYYWEKRNDIPWLNHLFANAAQSGVLRRDINLGITCLNTALRTLHEAGIMNSPDVWREKALNGPSQWLGNLLINMSNRASMTCRCENPVHPI